MTTKAVQHNMQPRQPQEYHLSAVFRFLRGEVREMPHIDPWCFYNTAPSMA